MQELVMQHAAEPGAMARHVPTRHEGRIDQDGLGQLVHSHAEHLDADERYWLRLHGYNLNPLVHAARSLLGMVLRVRQLREMRDIERLYRQVVDEIAAIAIEL